MNRNALIRRPFGYSYRSLSIWIIAINVLVFAGRLIVGGNLEDAYLGMTPSLMLAHGFFWQPLTYMFVHGSPTHILFNMLSLLFFGTSVEKELGSKEFLLFYLLIGILSGLFSFAVYIFTGGQDITLIGASGAVFAVQLAFATLQPRAKVLIWGIIPMSAPIMVLGFTAIELFSQVFGFMNGIAHLTHLAGFAFGWLYFLARFGVNPWRRFFPRR